MPLIVEHEDRQRWPAIALALLLTLGIFFGGLNALFGSDLVCLAYALLVCALALRLQPPPSFWRGLAPAVAPLALAWCWAALGASDAFGSRPLAPDLAPAALIGTAGYTFAFVAGAVIGWRRTPLPRLLDNLILPLLLTLLFALAMRGADDWPWTTWLDPVAGRFLGTLGNANAAGGTYAVLATLALARALREGEALWRSDLRLASRVRALGYWCALVLAIGGCALTESRSSAVFGVIALCTVVAPTRKRDISRRLRVAAIPVAVLLSIAVLLGTSELLIDRFARLPDELGVRTQLWRHNAAVALARPLFGYGIGGFPAVNGATLADIRDAQAMWMVNSPHNILLRLAIDAGLPYLALISIAGLVIAFRVAGAARRHGLDQNEVALAAAIGILTGVAMVDIVLEVPALAALAAVLAGLLWGRASRSRDKIGVLTTHLKPASAEPSIRGRRAGKCEDLRPELA